MNDNINDINSGQLKKNQSSQSVQSTQSVQPTQPIQSTQSNNKLEIVNPLNPNEILKVEELVSKQEIEQKDVDDNDTNNKQKKKSNKLIIILLLTILIIGLIVLIYFNFFNKTKSVPSTPNTPVEEPETKVTLNDIVDKFNSHSNLQNLKDLGYNCIAKVENDTIVVNVDEIVEEDTSEEFETSNTKQYIFELKDRNFTFSLNTNDEIYYNLYLTLIDSIGIIHGLEENEVISLLNSIDLTTNSIDGINVTQTENGIEITVNIDTKIDTTSLKTIYIGIDDLKEQESFIKDSGVAIIEKGNLKLYKQGDNKVTTIVIAEKNNLSILTYNSILSLVEFLYSNELTNFKTSYPELATISFNRYTITENPELIDEFKNFFEPYQSEYKFIEIKINKD